MSRLYARASLKRVPIHDRAEENFEALLSTECFAARNTAIGALALRKGIVLSQELRQPLKDTSIRVWWCWRGGHWQALSRLEGQVRHT